ncbi:MAG: hypothetical protein RL385_937, partial [Pseudomonadota bacterium]
RLLGHPVHACRASKPRRVRGGLAHGAPTPPSPSAGTEASAPGMHKFLGQLNTAHLLAYLRVAGAVTVTVAKLATGVGGRTLRRGGFTPAG